jgi:predicted nucleic acid-binding protein
LATHLADTSALVRVHHDDVAARAESMFISGRIATCAIVDLELLRAARTAAEHAAIWAERQLLPRAPLTDAGADRAVEVQGLLARAGDHRAVPLSDLLVAAVAEQAGLAVLHYDQTFDLIASVTGQPTEWVVAPGTVP